MRRLLLAFVFLALAGMARAEENKTVRFFLFYSSECDHCLEFREGVLVQLKNQYPLDVREFEVFSDRRNLELLFEMEKQYGSEELEFPVAFIGEDAVGGDVIDWEMETYVKKHLATGIDFPPIPRGFTLGPTGVETVDAALANATTSANASAGLATQTPLPIHMAYFFKIGCKECSRTSIDLQALRQKYPQLNVQEYDMQASESMRLNEALCQIYRVPEKNRQASPMIFIGSQVVSGKEASYSRLEAVIASHVPGGSKAPWELAAPVLKQSEKSIVKRFESFGVLTILAAGMVDGINPCAFATIIFFVSYLTLLGRKGTEVLMIGSAYTLSVFLAYYAVGVAGLEMLEFIQKMRFLAVAIDALFIVTGLLVLVFAGYSVYDYVLYKRGKTSEMILQLPNSIKQKIHKVIREKSRTSHYVLAAFAIGFIVSLQELFCTGQVYLPTLIYMSRIATYKTTAYLYLFFYNVLFILPLVVVFLLVYWGVSSQSLANWMKDHLGVMKLSLAAFFLVLGLVLIGSVLV